MRIRADRVTSRIDAFRLRLFTLRLGTLSGIVSTDNTLTDDLPFTRALFTTSTYALMHWQRIERKSKRRRETEKFRGRQREKRGRERKERR